MAKIKLNPLFAGMSGKIGNIVIKRSKNGVVFVDPPKEELAAARKRMQADVGTLIKDAKLSPEVVKLAEEAAAHSA